MAMSCNERACNDADKWNEKFNQYTVSMRHHIRGQHELIRDCRRESDLKSEKIEEQQKYITEKIEEQQKYITELEDALIIAQGKACVRECEQKSERIEELQRYIAGLEEINTRNKKLVEDRSIESARQSERIVELQREIQALQGTVRRLHQEGNNERINEWAGQGLLSRLEETREALHEATAAKKSLEKQLAHWMEQVNALQRQVQTLERRVPSLRH